jgi:uncharacterized protein
MSILFIKEIFHMRRKEKEIIKEKDIESIIQKALICRLGLSDGEKPYIVPLCFGYQNKTLYFHSSRKGKKLDIIRKNQHICFEIDINAEIIKTENACRWGMKYQSVIGFGRAIIIENFDEKQKALEIIMKQYAEKKFDFSDSAIAKISVIKVEIENMTGKQSPS